ncbi:MAG: HD domain-containing protein, partial [Clostridium sp.]|nr:HD domain-containing protein [Clostridium sp.]
MYDYMLPMSNRGIISVAKRAFDLVDARLMGHGQRVASIMYQLMKADGGYDGRKMRDMLTLAVLHDIGAYKTEEIDKMVEFETENVWNHSIYGYLFFYYFSLLKELSGIVLYHHTPWNVLRRMDHVPDHIKKASQLLHLADRIDIYFEHSAGDVDWLKQYLGTQRDQNFCGEVLDLFEGMDFVAPGSSSLFLEHEYIQIMEEVPFSSREKQSILRMLVYAIDFRSTHTVTHTITTTIISSELALRLCERADTINDVIFGAMLHDLGKIGIPVEILEFPGRLSPQAMNVMRGHVKMTEYILQDCVSDAVRDIALRHHEKLDGSG